ncbi:MAG: sigma 54-interacting transcriptional regulator [Eubacterium sp.]
MITIDKIEHAPEYKAYLEQLPQETLLKIVENAFAEIFVNDKDGRIIYANPACMRYHGLKPESLVGKLSSEMKQGIWEPHSFKEVIEKKHPIITENMYYLTHKSLMSVNVPVFDKSGEIELVISTAQDYVTRTDLSYRTSEKSIVSSDSDFSDKVIGSSEAFKHCLKKLEKAVNVDLNVLILGESGTGKSFLAETLHKHSLRKDKPFFAINCAAIPENLLESELFGYAPNAFTGADPKGKAGLIKNADGGTLFLDEIAELSLPLQAKILDMLENKRYIPVGANAFQHVDIRITAATNQNLITLIKQKKFRSDLYWRLNIIKVTILPLRERKEDIILLANYFLKKSNQKYGTNKLFDKKMMYLISDYDWPGNIRQLKNAIERLVVYSDHMILDEDLFMEYLCEEGEIPTESKACAKTYNLEDIKYNLVSEVYTKYKSSRKLAEIIGVSQSTANRLIKKYIHGDPEL